MFLLLFTTCGCHPIYRFFELSPYQRNTWQSHAEIYRTVHIINSKKMRQRLKFSPAYTRLSVRWSSQQVKNDKDWWIPTQHESCWVIILKLREHCSHKSKKKKEPKTEKKKNRTSSHNIFKFKTTEEIKKYKSIYHSHFEGQTDWFSNAYLLFG